MLAITELIACTSGLEVVTYRGTWPHEYVLTEEDNQRELLDAVCNRFRDGEGIACRFFRIENTYVFIGEYKYWLMTNYNDIDAYNNGGDYLINRARLYRNQRDFIMQPGDTRKPDDYPQNPSYNPVRG